MAIPESIPLNNLHILAQGCTHNDSSTLRNGYCLTLSTPTTAQQDSGNELWDMYLDEVKEEDKRMSDAWKEDSNGILVFTGLFSAAVGAFIIEFHKTLSPNSSDQTAGTHRAAMIWVNSMWLISLVLSLTSALVATLLQQWARRYVETPKETKEPNDRARVRSFLFLGTKSYKMRLAVQIAPTLLHLSVYLFFGGLVIIFHTINKKVAVAVDVAVGLSGLAYIALSVLPCFDVQCPYSTPMSDILWYPRHILPLITALCLRWFLRLLHGCLVPGNQNNRMPCIRRMIISYLVRWLNSCRNAVRAHCQYIKNGLEKSIINDAIQAQGDSDSKMVTWLFSRLTLGDRSKLRKFAASIPRDKVLDLIPPTESLYKPLHILFQSCAAGTPARTRLVGPDEDVRKRSLLVCLEAIHCISKAPVVPNLHFVQTNFTDINLMEPLWDDSDTVIRITSSSICALIARQVIKETPTVQRLRWLHRITSEEREAVRAANIVTRHHMNFKSFVSKALSNQEVDDLSTKDTTSFKETLAILLDVRDDVSFADNNSQSQLSEEVQWIQDHVDTQDSHEVVAKLRSMFRFLPAAPPPP